MPCVHLIHCIEKGKYELVTQSSSMGSYKWSIDLAGCYNHSTVLIQCSKAREQNFWTTSNCIVKLYYHFIWNINKINRWYLHLNGCAVSFIFSIILAILQSTLWHHRYYVMSWMCTMMPATHQPDRISHNWFKFARSVIKPTKATTVLAGIPDPELHIQCVLE